MQIVPTLEKVQEIASARRYRVLPVSCEILSDFTTPIEAMRILKQVSTHCYMLESAASHETWGRYTFLGFDPSLEITCRNGEMRAGCLHFPTADPSAYLRQVLEEHKSPRFDHLPPFTGGLVGYFSYDYLGYSEPSVRAEVEDSEEFRDLDLMLFDKVIAFDHLRQKLILMVNMSLDEPETSYNKAVLELKRISRDFKLPVIAVSSLNRMSYGQRISMEAFKESGAIEYSSDVLIGLQLRGAGEATFDPTEAKKKNPRQIEAVILKNRNGRVGEKIEFEYYPMFNYFTEKG